MTAAAPTHVFADAGDVPVLRWPALDALRDRCGVDAVVTTRHGGVSTGPYASLNLGMHVGDDPSAVVENRRRAATAVGLDLDDLVFCNQTHSRNAVVVDAAKRGRGTQGTDDALDDVDAVVTTSPDVGLVVMVADCVPIVLVDPDAAVLACVHAGWRGTTAGIAAVAVDTMRSLGARPERIVAVLGPSIDAARYQVGDDVADAARVAFGDDVDAVVRPDGTGRWTFDGRAANRLVLCRAGVAADNVVVADVDTAEGDFFSDRAVRPCGRFAAIARLAGERAA